MLAPVLAFANTSHFHSQCLIASFIVVLHLVYTCSKYCRRYVSCRMSVKTRTNTYYVGRNIGDLVPILGFVESLKWQILLIKWPIGLSSLCMNSSIRTSLGTEKKNNARILRTDCAKAMTSRQIITGSGLKMLPHL